MNLFVFGVIVAVSVTQCRAQKYPFGRCPKVSVKEGLDVQKFLGGWYEIEKNFEEKGIKCKKSNYRKEDDHLVLEVQSKLEATGSPISYGSKALMPDKSGPTKLKVQMFGIAPLYVDSWILDTDYTQYAVMYTCFNVAGLVHGEYVFVWSRKPTLDQSVRDKIHQMLDNYKISSTSLMPMDQDC